MDIKKPSVSSPSRHVQADSTQKVKKKNASFVASISLVVAVIALVAVALLGYERFKTGGSVASVSSEVQKERFQAVFLTNGQVYFGKLSNVEGNYIKLENIYYLQVQQSVQPSTSNPENSNTSDDSQVSLTKLGKELHGPTDQMYISRSEVLFWENLEKESTVVKAIADYENKN